MKKLLFIILFSVVASSAVTSGQEIRQLQLNEAQMIDTSANNYGLYDPDLLSRHNWNTVSVNDATVTIWSPDCQVSSQELSDEETKSLNEARERLDGVDKSRSYDMNQRMGVSKFSSDGQLTSLVNINNGCSSTSSFCGNGVQYISNGNNSFSIAKPSLPNNLARVFHDDKLTTFVYHNGTVQMQPNTCLSSDDQQLVEQLKMEQEKMKKEMQESQERHMRNMNRDMERMNENMRRRMEEMQRNMQQNMDRSMENMNRNMENMNSNLNFHGRWSW